MKTNRPADFLMFTDGSGYKDGYGGWACLVKTSDSMHQMFRMGAVIGCTVDRMEMTAILEGLQLVVEMTPWAVRRPEEDRNTWRPKVRMFSDRENLVLSIQGVYDRSNSPDLWHRFQYYETLLDIEPVHVLRETDHPEFVTVDMQASTARIIAKEYGLATDLQRHCLPQD